MRKAKPIARARVRAALDWLGRIRRGPWRRCVSLARHVARDAARHENLLITAVLAIGILISAAGFLATRYHYRTLAQQEFDRPASHYAAVIGRAIDRYIEVLNPIGAYFSASKEVERWEFLSFAEDTLPRYPGLSAVLWVPRVPAAARARYERKASRDGLFGFGIRDWGAGGKQNAAGERDEYFPIYFVEPFKGNQAYLGVDLASDPIYRAALDRARDAGGTSVTGWVPSHSETGPRRTLLSILPIYRTGRAPSVPADRRDALIGFVVGVIDIEKMVAATLDTMTTPAGLDVYLYDESADRRNRLLHFSLSSAGEEPPRPAPRDTVLSGLHHLARQAVADRQWSIVVVPAPGHFNNRTYLIPWGVAIVSMLLTALLVQYLITARNRHRAIEKSVAERTAELSATNTALEQEVAERKRAEHDARAARDQAEVANRAKSQFLAMVSHELRTPLNAIIGFSEILSNQTFGKIGNKRYLEYANDIQDSGTHLLSLINDILDLSKIEANESTLTEETVDVAETVAAAVRLIKDKATGAGLEIGTDLAEPLPALKADNRAVKQILINLLFNAVKFTPEGGRVTIAAQVLEDGGFEITVTDTGIGIAAEHLAMVMQPFSQVDNSLARRYEGTGLGLPLSKKFAELHGGSLELESELGRGTVARIRFPEERVLSQLQAADGA